jgi:hypothetical protein
MKKTIIISLSIFLCLLVSGGVVAKNSKKVKNQPRNPVVQALLERHSTKTFTEQKLDERDLSNILWAAAGINRPEFDDDFNVIGGKLTIPTAMNVQHVMVYAVLEEGVYQYNPIADDLVLILEGDYRADAAYQPPYQTAPLNLIFVADLTKWPEGFSYPTRDEWIYTAAISVGCAAENVYLYLAGTKKLGGTYRTAMDKALWHDDYLNLDELEGEQIVMGGMTIGYPAPVE